jgi:hypothetical protein
MLTAIRLSDKKKVIGDYIDKDSSAKYICEYCDNEVVHHKSDSKIRVGHFKHKSNQSFCPNQGETIEHMQAKLQIFHYIKNNWGKQLKLIEFEKYLCNKSIRPDIYIESKKQTKIAIEVQATILTLTEIKRRTEKYYKERIYVLWILPFDYSRFYQYKSSSGWREDGTWGYSDSGYELVDKIRLKEYELFIYWAYFKRIILWDLNQKYSNGFIVAFLNEYKSETVEFRRDGEEYYFEGKKSNVMKAPVRIKYNIPFDHFKPRVGKLFEHNNRDYNIPPRTIFNYNIKV